MKSPVAFWFAILSIYCFSGFVFGSDYNWTDNGDGTCTINSYIGTDSDVTIPDTIDGLSVITIGEKAFYNINNLTSLNFGNSVKTIDYRAVNNCSNLTNVTIGSSLTTIDGDSLHRCNSLATINVHLESTTFCSIDGVLFNKDQTELIICPQVKSGEYFIPDSVTCLGNRAFAHCSNLTAIFIPNSVTAIESEAFIACTGVADILVPDSVTTIENRAFYYCGNLMNINVSENNNAFSSVDGVLFTKDQSLLIQFPGGKSGSYSIGDNTIGIGDHAFNSCRNLTSITIADSVRNIGHSAFMYSGITSAMLGNGVTNIGDYAFCECYDLTNVAIPASVTSIGNSAFNSTAGLSSINVNPANTTYSSVDGVLLNKEKTELIHCPQAKTGEYLMPGSVTFICNRAFYGCDKLTGVVLSPSVESIDDYAFYGCDGLTNIAFPDSLITIGDSAFRSCDGLTNLTIPDSVTSIGDRVFMSCDVLSNVIIGNGIKSLGDWAFAYCYDLRYLSIAYGVSSIGDKAFYACKSLANFSIPGSVTIIGDSAFAHCDGLKNLNIPDSVTTIEDEAFYSCGGLTSVNIPDNVSSVGDYAFSQCRHVTSVTIGSGVSHIGKKAFDTYYLEVIAVDPANTAYSSLEGVLFNKDMTDLIQYPTRKTGDYIVPDSVTSIGFDAFYYCHDLSSVLIPESVTSIAGGAFADSHRLMDIIVSGDNSAYCSVDGVLFNKDQNAIIQFPGGKRGQYTIPDSVKSIGYKAFAECAYLSNVSIPYGVSSIGEKAFYGCNSLVNILIPGSVTSIEDFAFHYTSSLTDIYFQGNAPEFGIGVFYHSNPTIHYLPGTTGWESTYGGLETVQWRSGAADIAGSFGVNLEDFAVVAMQWGNSCDPEDNCNAADIFNDGIVDILDLQELAVNWLAGKDK